MGSVVTEDGALQPGAEYRRWQRRVFGVLWITYASYYLCRLNMGVAQGALMREVGATKAEFGWVLTGLSVAYGIGQLVNGQICDRVGGRIMGSVGMFGSAAINLAFGWAGSLRCMIVLWAANGFFQSMGFSSCVKTLANWFPVRERGRASGWFSLSYKVGNAATWIAAGCLVQCCGWRAGFIVPALVLLASAAHFATRTRNAPEDVGLPPVEKLADGGAAESGRPSSDRYLGLSYTISQTLLNGRLWLAALAGMMLAVTNYGFLYWLPTYLEAGDGELAAAVRSSVYPLAGCAGALFCGWSSDRFLDSRRAPVVIGMMLAGGALTVLCAELPRNAGLAFLPALAIMGALLMGAHAHIVTSMSMDFGTRKAAASATGFIDAMGYIGAAVAGAGSGWVIDDYGWSAAIRIWGLCAVAGALILAPLWKVRGGTGRYQ